MGVPQSRIIAEIGQPTIEAATNMCNNLRQSNLLTSSDPIAFSFCMEEATSFISLERGRHLSISTNLRYETKMLECAALSSTSENVLEGGSFFYPFKIPALQNLVEPIIDSKPDLTICEVGFNAGHSSLMWLLLSTTSNVLAFDLGEHGYAKSAAKYLQTRFGSNRISVTFGDSRETLPQFRGTCDVVFVDGGHSYDVAYSDITNLAEPGTLLIVDDINQDEVGKAYHDVINAGIVTELGVIFEDAHYQDPYVARSSIGYGTYNKV